MGNDEIEVFSALEVLIVIEVRKRNGWAKIMSKYIKPRVSCLLEISKFTGHHIIVKHMLGSTSG